VKADEPQAQAQSNPLLKEVYDIRHESYHRRLRIVSSRSHEKVVEVRVAVVSF